MRSKRMFEKPAADHATRDAIVQAAERLFAQHGIEETTMRQITADAEVNLASVNYHFGSKLGLAYSVFDRIAEDICASRNAELDALEETAKGRPTKIEDIVRAFLRSYVEGDERRASLLIRLIQLHRFSPSNLTKEISRRRFDPVARRFVSLMERALPHLSRRAVYWRFHLMLGAVLAAVSDAAPQNRLARLSGGLADASRRIEMIEQVTEFLVSAMTSSARSKKDEFKSRQNPKPGIARTRAHMAGAR